MLESRLGMSELTHGGIPAKLHRFLFLGGQRRMRRQEALAQYVISTPMNGFEVQHAQHPVFCLQDYPKPVWLVIRA